MNHLAFLETFQSHVYNNTETCKPFTDCIVYYMKLTFTLASILDCNYKKRNVIKILKSNHNKCNLQKHLRE